MLINADELKQLHHKGEYEFEFIKKVTEEVSSKLNPHLLHIADYPVGLQARMQQIQQLMDASFDNKVTMIGIHGMGGIGKSTVARAIYNLKAHEFEASSFIANVRENSTKHGLVHIQKTILSELVGERNIKLGDVYRGIPILQQRLCRKEVLLVLDDIDKKEQLQATAGGLDWFGRGSIIIITTRDKHLLKCHGVENLYEIKELNDAQSLELFRWNAFKNKKIDPNYMELIKRALYFANGLPLALEIIGCNMYDKTLDEWDSAIEAYERYPNRDVQKILRVSYDSLDTNEGEIFLDIACFFSGYTLRYVTDMLMARGFHPKIGIRVLKDKSLIKTVKQYDRALDTIHHQIVIMHDLIRSMGKEIVDEQSKWPHKRTRLWFYDDIISVLKMNTNSKVLRLLILKSCKNIRRIPNMSGFPNLTELNISECTNLTEIHDSVGFLCNLKVFRAGGCTGLIFGPSAIKLPSLEHLCLRDCSSLVNFPEILAPMKKLRIVELKGTAIKHPPLSMNNLEGLQDLCLERCKIPKPSNFFQKLPVFFPNLEELYLNDSDLTILPACIEECHSLKLLFVFNCKKLKEIRGFPPSLTNFSAENTSVEAVSQILKLLLRQAISSTTIDFYAMPGQRIPEWFDHSSRGNSLLFLFRNELPSLTVCAVSEVWDNIKPRFEVYFNFFVTINDNDISVCEFVWWHRFRISGNDHIFMINTNQHVHRPMNSDIERALETNEWIRGKITFVFNAAQEDSRNLQIIKWVGVYVNRAFSRLENIRFTDPNTTSTSGVGNQLVLFGEAPDIRQQQQFKNMPSYSNSHEAAYDKDGAFLDHQAMATSFAETQNARMQIEMGTLISKVSRECSHESRDYNIESTTTESRQVDEVEVGLQTNKTEFGKTMSLENEIHQKLSRIKKMTEDLGEQLSAVKANISSIEASISSVRTDISSIKDNMSAPQSECNMDCETKSNIRKSLIPALFPNFMPFVIPVMGSNIIDVTYGALDLRDESSKESLEKEMLQCSEPNETVRSIMSFEIRYGGKNNSIVGTREYE
ncbi:hypothetical protein Fmac_015636 [Flemingia macrophylla]|uniref:TMV resistance protein N n=1 Tax=Flemingia macrophylla TaxID=520843 RepID=A0ABD1MF43_9FABA